MHIAFACMHMDLKRLPVFIIIKYFKRIFIFPFVRDTFQSMSARLLLAYFFLMLFSNASKSNPLAWTRLKACFFENLIRDFQLKFDARVNRQQMHIYQLHVNGRLFSLNLEQNKRKRNEAKNNIMSHCVNKTRSFVDKQWTPWYSIDEYWHNVENGKI